MTTAIGAKALNGSIDYTPEMAHASVLRGAAWLDAHCPDWVNMVNLKRLDLGSNTFCMLGQTARCLLPDRTPNGKALRNGFDKVDRFFADKEGWDYKTAGTLGFNIPTGLSDYRFARQRVMFEMLTIAWRGLIHERLEGAK